MKEALSTTLTGLAVLLAASLISAAVMGGFSARFEAPAPLNPFDMERRAAEKGVSLVRTEEMRDIVASGSHLILDARSQSQYDQGHIPTAMPVPVRDFEESFPLIAPLLGPEIPVVVYCSGPFCDDALYLIERIAEAGFPGARLYLDGMEGWSE